MKLYVHFFLLFFLSLSSLLASDVIPDECGYFASAVSTRTQCTDSGGGSIEFSGEANIYDNNATILVTCTVITPDWVLNDTETCESGDCEAEPGNAKSLSIDYSNTPSEASTSSSPSSSTTDVTVSGDVTLDNAEYNDINFVDSANGKTLTFEQTTGWTTSAQTLKVNSISSAWQIVFKNSVDIEMGSISGATYGGPISLKTDSDADIDTISIDNVYYKENSVIDLQANDSIDINSFTVGRSSSSVTLKAKNITIDNLTVSNSGDNQAYITLIGDNINIGTLDMGQGAKVTILPYTSGGEVTLKSNVLKASSSSELVLSSGNYFTGTFDIPGTSDASSVRALDENQVVNLYINGDFKPGNNPGINSDGNNGNFGTLPAKNFRMFINGDLDTGGGGTTFNAVIYIEGDATLGNPTYIKGALSAYNYISIGEGSKIYFAGDASSEAYKTCPIYAEGDICYETPIVEGVQIGPLDFMYGVTTPLKNISGDHITDATIIKSFDGIDMSLMSEIGIDGVDKTLEKDGDEAETNTDLLVSYGIFNASGIFDKGIVYRISDFETNATHTIYDKSKFAFDMSKIKIDSIYTKNGRRYYSEVAPCEAISNAYETGPFDAWDDAVSTRGINDRNISTKIVNHDFNLTIASINAAGNGLEAKNNVDVRFRLYDNNTSSYLGGNWADYNASLASYGEKKTFTFTFGQSPATAFTLLPKAHKDIEVRFEVCADYDGSNFILHPYAECSSYCSSNTQTTEDSPCIRLFKSSDNFAIRPYGFAVFGQNQYKRAGEDFNLTIKAVDEGNYTKLGNSSYLGINKDSIDSVGLYGAKLSDLNIISQFYNPTSSELTTMRSDTGRTDVSTCSNSGIFTVNNGSDSFVNGEANASLNFSETGILDINISEKPGFEWAKVDSDDTPDIQRYIKPSIVSYDESNITAKILMLFVPYKFETTADYKTTTSKSWVYMNDINGSNISFTTPKLAAYITYKIVAKNKNGAITKNYTKTCFPDVDEVSCPRVNGLKLNTTFDLFLNADLNISSDANISLYSENNTSTAIWTPQKNIMFSKGLNSIQEWISPFEFENGVGEAKVYLNIDKDVSKALNPIVIEVKDANTSTSWMSNPGSPKAFVPSSIDKNVTFYYGRIHAPDYRVKGSSVDVNVYREIYCKSCNQANFSEIGNESIDSVYWYVNKDDNSINDGKINNFITSSKINTVSPVAPISNGVQTYTFTYNAGLFPYKENVEINASSWLIYNPYNSSATTNDFSVEYLGDGGWAGIGKTGKTVDLNISSKGTKRLEW